MLKLFNPPTSSSEKGNFDEPDVIDADFDNVSVPNTVGEAAAKEENTVVSEKSQSEERSFVMGKVSPTDTNPEALDEGKKNEGDSLEKVLSNFDMNCCFKNLNKHVEDSEPETLNGDDEAATKDDDPSLSEFAARMNEIDLESGETAEDDFHVGTTKDLLPWYRETLYAAMIVLCFIFTIAIIVMSVLIFGK
jgi:hypothetical protein